MQASAPRKVQTKVPTKAGVKPAKKASVQKATTQHINAKVGPTSVRDKSTPAATVSLKRPAKTSARSAKGLASANVLLSPALHEQLKALARQRSVPKSLILRQALIEYLIAAVSSETGD